MTRVHNIHHIVGFECSSASTGCKDRSGPGFSLKSSGDCIHPLQPSLTLPHLSKKERSYTSSMEDFVDSFWKIYGVDTQLDGRRPPTMGNSGSALAHLRWHHRSWKTLAEVQFIMWAWRMQPPPPPQLSILSLTCRAQDSKMKKNQIVVSIPWRLLQSRNRKWNWSLLEEMMLMIVVLLTLQLKNNNLLHHRDSKILTDVS